MKRYFDGIFEVNAKRDMTNEDTTELFLCILLVMLAIGCCIHHLGRCALNERRTHNNRHTVTVSRRGLEMGVLLRTGVIPLVIYVKGEEEEVCVVCLSEMEEGDMLRMLRCGHAFHGECVDPWLMAQQTCPLCKADVMASTSTLV